MHSPRQVAWSTLRMRTQQQCKRRTEAAALRATDAISTAYTVLSHPFSIIVPQNHIVVWHNGSKLQLLVRTSIGACEKLIKTFHPINSSFKQLDAERLRYAPDWRLLWLDSHTCSLETTWNTCSSSWVYWPVLNILGCYEFDCISLCVRLFSILNPRHRYDCNSSWIEYPFLVTWANVFVWSTVSNGDWLVSLLVTFYVSAIFLFFAHCRIIARDTREVPCV